MEVLIARGGAMVKKTLTIVVLLFLFLWTAPAFAASQTVSVKIAEFPVTLEDGWIYTVYMNHRKNNDTDISLLPVPVRVNIETKQIELL
jgi:hypothetical protein